MKSSKSTRALRYCIISLVVLTIALFAVSIHTLFTGLAGAIQGETFGLNLDEDEATGDWLITFDANPRNPGLLGTRLFIQLQILSVDGEQLAANSTSVYIAPGGRGQFSLTLFIPREDIQRYITGEEEGIFEMKFGISTLADLVGFTQTMRIQGEAPT